MRLRRERVDNEAMMNNWFEENDSVIVDKRYRDITQLLPSLSITSRISPLIEADERQHST